MMLKRRTFAAATLAAGLPGMPAIAQAKPVTIACITTLSGAAGILGKPQYLGMQLAAKRVNDAGGILGRPVETLVRDDESNPNTAVAAVRELAGNGVKIFAGVLSSPVALAIGGIAEELDIILVNAAAHGNNLTHEDFHRNYFRVTDYTVMRMSAGARLVAERFPEVTRWGSIIPDAEIGRSVIATTNWALPKYYRELHGKEVTILDPAVVKFGATDFRGAISSLLSQNVEGIVVGVGGGDEVGFVQQAGQLGLTRRVKAFLASGSDFQMAKALGRRLPANYWSGHHWYFGAYKGNPVSDGVYDQYAAQTGDKWPDGFVGMGSTAVNAVAAAAKRAGDLSTKAMVAGLEGLTFDSVKGKVTIRKEDHQALCDVNHVRLDADEGGTGWKVGDYKVSNGADFAGPATPGSPVKFS